MIANLKANQLNVIGISAGYHDSACVLLQNGRLVAAVQEERFSRVKNDKAMPVRAFRHCLKQGGLSISDVDCLAYYEEPALKLGRQLWMAQWPDAAPERRRSIVRRAAGLSPAESLSRVLGYDGRLEFVEHHLCHAASSFYFSGFPEAATFVADGVGDWATTSYGRASGSSLHLFEQVDFPDSLGLLYSAITSYLGFEVNEGEYKVMGLAPYGEPSLYSHLSNLVAVGRDGRFQLDMKYFRFMRDDVMYSDALPDLLGERPRRPGEPVTAFHLNVARSMQLLLEDILVEKIRYLHSRVPGDNLCMAGGVALNVVANTRCLQESPFTNLFVQPAAGDAGAALGAAAIAQIRLTGEPPPQVKMPHVYLGPACVRSEIVALLEGSSAVYEDCVDQEEKLIRLTVDALKRGEIVGWVSGRMEFGPRALGARSILADPRRPDMRDRVNAIVKKRESFRPFAPSVLASHAEEYFALPHPSPFMMEISQVRSRIPLPAVTHVDNTARIQTVDGLSSPRFFRLLTAFFEQTGCPVLLNTSFNMRGEPIVCSAYDAVLCFVRSRLDALVLDDFFVPRSGVPGNWEVEATRRSRRRTGQDVHRAVYASL